MNPPRVKSISAEERKQWEKHNLDTLREWRAISFTEKIRMVEGIVEVARSIHGGKLPPSPDEHGEAPL